MYVNNIKEAVTRSGAFAMAVSMLSILGISAFPSLVFANALNPLTERTLLMTSSAPGYNNTDGSGNATYAPPGSGPNGQKAGHKFSFKVSTDSSGSGAAIDGFSFQYCTTAAGNCTSPGNDTVVAPGDDQTPGTADDRVDNAANKESDLNVSYANPQEVTAIPTSNPDGLALVDADNSDGNFAVLWDSNNDGVDELNAGWEMDVQNYETPSAVTVKNNFIRLRKATTGSGNSAALKPAPGVKITVVFYATDDNFITNPGSGNFFVRLNTYKTNVYTSMLPNSNTNILDGGVTVANVMTDSIHITTKVLETMSFSVGTENPDYLPAGGGQHGPCDPIEDNDQIQLGNANAESSLEVNTAYDAKSYWRLSSNSSAGASVYYSGSTLSNTVGDKIDPAGFFVADGSGKTAFNGTNVLDFAHAGGPGALSHPGMEQFGLAFDPTEDRDNDGVADLPDGNVGEQGPGNDLKGLIMSDAYNGGAGRINKEVVDPDDSSQDLPITAKFAFDPSSQSTPALIASNTTDVVDCSTGKMRYIGNIAAATPAGVYTTKINYLAAPQY